MADVVDQAELKLLQERLRHLHGSVTMLPGSWDKRFVKSLWNRDPATLTEKQRNTVQSMAYRYRRQMPAELVPERVQLPREAKKNDG